MFSEVKACKASNQNSDKLNSALEVVCRKSWILLQRLFGLPSDWKLFEGSRSSAPELHAPLMSGRV